MTSGVTAVVSVPTIDHSLLETLDSLARQTTPLDAVVLVAETENERELSALRGICAAPGRQLRRQFSAADLETSTLSILWVEAGEILAEGFLEQARSSLDARPAAGWVTARLSRQWPTGAAERAVEPRSLDPGSLLVDPWALPRVALYERAALEAHGCPDGSLGPLAQLDLWLRLIAARRAGELISEALVLRRPNGASRPATGDYLARFVQRHGGSLRGSAGILRGTQQHLQDETQVYRERLRRRDEALQAIRGLESQIAERREALRRHGMEGTVWGELRLAAPISRQWGEDRGAPIDRHYINRFVRAHHGDLRGAVLEVQEDDLSEAHGGGLIERIDIVDVESSNSRATVLADLRSAAHIPDSTYDCFVLTQTLHVIADMPAVLREAYRILKPGGVLLATLPAASRVCVEYGREGDFWRVTEAGARELFRPVFGERNVSVTPYGNLLTTIAFLHGLACHELGAHEFEAYDPWYPLLFGVRAVKPALTSLVSVESTSSPGAVLLYHRVAELALDPHRLALAPSVFVGQMRELAARLRPMSLTDLASGARAGSLPPGAVAVTFDDAYSEAIDRISPVLTELGIPATFFAVGNQTLSPQTFWWDTLADLLLGDSLLPPALDITIGGETRRLATGSEPERRRAHDALHPLLVRASLAVRDEAMTALLAWAGCTPHATGSALDRVGLLALADRPGHTIGAHGLAHLALAAQSPAARAEEIGGSKAVLEGLLGRPVTAFAYPYGDVNSSVARAARGAGYELAVSCEPEPLRATSDPWRLPRIEIHSGNSDRFGAILAEALGLA